jgi:hypothetical protein
MAQLLPRQHVFLLLLIVMAVLLSFNNFKKSFEMTKENTEKDTGNPTNGTLPNPTIPQNASTRIDVFSQDVHDGHFHEDCHLIYVHFHKAGGTSMVNFMQEQMNLKNIQQGRAIDAIPEGPDLVIYRPWTHGIRISSVSEVGTLEHRAGQPKFWTNLKKRGCDFVSLEYNFLTPPQFDSVFSSCIQFWTILRDPWRRFRSTYEREVQMECGNKKKYEDEDDRANCTSKNSLEEWMKTGNLPKQFPRKNSWGGTLYPNYYVRMLNGINDRRSVAKQVPLTEFHLEQAKSVLRRFDLVLLLENQTDTLSRMDHFFNIRTDLPKKSNNGLKAWPLYEKVVNEANKQRDLFEEQNVLDRKLYNYVKEELIRA